MNFICRRSERERCRDPLFVSSRAQFGRHVTPARRSPARVAEQWRAATAWRRPSEAMQISRHLLPWPPQQRQVARRFSKAASVGSGRRWRAEARSGEPDQRCREKLSERFIYREKASERFIYREKLQAVERNFPIRREKLPNFSTNATKNHGQFNTFLYKDRNQTHCIHLRKVKSKEKTEKKRERDKKGGKKSGYSPLDTFAHWNDSESESKFVKESVR